MEIIRLHKVETNLATLSFGDITAFKTLVTVSLISIAHSLFSNQEGTSIFF